LLLNLARRLDLIAVRCVLSVGIRLSAMGVYRVEASLGNAEPDEGARVAYDVQQTNLLEDSEVRLVNSGIGHSW
jgi:hypothetical protein